MKDQTSNVFEALAHPTRRQILQDLKNGELTAGDIAAKPQATRPTISRQLRVLREADLVSKRCDATRIYYSLVSDSLALSVGNFLSSVCPEQVELREVRNARHRRAAQGVYALARPAPRCRRAAQRRMAELALRLAPDSIRLYSMPAGVANLDGAPVMHNLPLTKTTVY